MFWQSELKSDRNSFSSLNGKNKSNIGWAIFSGDKSLFSTWYRRIRLTLQHCIFEIIIFLFESSQKSTDLVTYTEKILKGKLYFLCCATLPTLTGISGRSKLKDKSFQCWKYLYIIQNLRLQTFSSIKFIKYLFQTLPDLIMSPLNGKHLRVCVKLFNIQSCILLGGYARLIYFLVFLVFTWLH